MKDGFATNSEILFQNLCEGLGLIVSKIPTEANKKTPDFKVKNKTTMIVAEVKQHESSEAKKAKEWLDKNPGQFQSGNVDFNNTGRMDRILRKQKKQLKASCKLGIATLAVIYPEETNGPTDYACQIQLERGLLELPREISAVMYMENEGVQYLNQKPKAQVYTNGEAYVKFPENFFPE